MGVYRRRIISHSRNPQLSILSSSFSHYRKVEQSLEVGFLIAFIESAIFYVEDNALLHYYYAHLLPHCDQVDRVLGTRGQFRHELKEVLLESSCSSVDQFFSLPEYVQMLEVLAASLLANADSSASAEFSVLERLALSLRTRLVVLRLAHAKESVREFGPVAELTVFLLETDRNFYVLYPKLDLYATLTAKKLIEFIRPVGSSNGQAELQQATTPLKTRAPLLAFSFSDRKTYDSPDALSERQPESLVSGANNLNSPKPTTRPSYSSPKDQEVTSVVARALNSPLGCCSSFLSNWWPGVAILVGVVATAFILLFATS